MPANSNNKAFGSKVRGLRDQLGLSQEKLAERAGLHRTYISDVERGDRNISLGSINKLAVALRVSAADLLLPGQEPLPGRLIEILLVEDDLNDVELTRAALRQMNLVNRVQVVNDGAAALSFLAGSGGPAERRREVLPDLILLDLGLPKVDGMEVLRQIKANPRTRPIPVVVLTVSSRTKDIQTSEQLGAHGYIVKPVELHNFLEITPQLSFQWALLASQAEVVA